jgi:hypothetical protein
MHRPQSRALSTAHDLATNRWFAAALLVVCLALMSWQASAGPAATTTPAVAPALERSHNAEVTRKPAKTADHQRLLALLALIAGASAAR